MSKTLRFLLFFLLISSCSLDNKSGIWTNSDKVKTDEDLIVEELFQEEKKLNKEFNTNVRK